MWEILSQLQSLPLLPILQLPGVVVDLPSTNYIKHQERLELESSTSELHGTVSDVELGQFHIISLLTAVQQHTYYGQNHCHRGIPVTFRVTPDQINFLLLGSLEFSE